MKNPYYIEGYEAIGIAFLSCPYPRLTLKWIMWREGWVDRFMKELK